MSREAKIRGGPKNSDGLHVRAIAMGQDPGKPNANDPNARVPLPLIPMLVADQAAAGAWRLGDAGIRELFTKSSAGRLLVILFNDHGDAVGLSKREFYALEQAPGLGEELNLVVAGRRNSEDSDITRLAALIETHLPPRARDGLAREMAADAIAVASFAQRTPEELSRYLVARVEEVDRILTDVQENTEQLLDGQRLLTTKLDEATALLRDAESVNAHRVVRYVMSDWGPEGARRTLDALGHADPALLEQLQLDLGQPVRPDALQRIASARPAWLRAGPTEGFIAMAALCQQFALWDEASDFFRAGAHATDAEGARADLLVRAAVAANVAGDERRARQLLDEARRVDPEAPRLRLEEASQLSSAEAQFAALAGISTEDPELSALLEAQLALASLLAADCENARRHLELAVAAAPEMHQLALVKVNIVVHEARIAIDGDRAVDATSLANASHEARRLRAELLAVGRFEESGRTLMLLCDAQALLGEINDAKELIARARGDEVAAGQNAEVLADVALRLSDYRLALTFLRDYPQTPGSVRQRAWAEIFTGSSETVENALDRLSDLTLAGGEESMLAGANRLLCCVEKPYLRWDDDVAEVLLGAGHARLVVGARVRQLALRRYFEDAQALLEPYDHTIWAREGQLFIAVRRGRPQDIASAANALLTAGPDPPMTVLCGVALMASGEHDRAGQVLIGVAHSTGAAVGSRADAYHGALITVANGHNDWRRVRELFEEWQALVPDDERLADWSARLLSHPDG